MLRWIRSHGVHQGEISLSFMFSTNVAFLVFVYRQILHDAILLSLILQNWRRWKKDTASLNSVQVAWL